MGGFVWAAAGVVAFAIARLLRSGGALTWPVELLIGVAAGIAFGTIATVFDFGGWRELEWRAAAFALAGASLVLAFARAARLAIANRR